MRRIPTLTTNPVDVAEKRRVLVADENPLNRQLMRRRLVRRGYVVDAVATAAEVLAHLPVETPDIVLMDLALPDMSGLECLQRIRDQPRTHRLPVVLVSAFRESDDIVDGLRRGANDYVTKPIDFDVLVARMETHLSHASLLVQLETKKHMLARLATTDELTGAFNRRSLVDALDGELSRARRDDVPLSLLLFDVDHFKRVNDTYGHPAGDAVLCEIVERSGRVLRGSDLLSRYGGEEFCVLMPETPAPRARQTSELLRQVTAEVPFYVGEHEIVVTISVGVATLMTDDDAASLIGRSDKALYLAKDTGRNRVCGRAELMSRATATVDGMPALSFARGAR